MAGTRPVGMFPLREWVASRKIDKRLVNPERGIRVSSISPIHLAPSRPTIAHRHCGAVDTRVHRLFVPLKRLGFLAKPSRRQDYVLGSSIWRLSRNYDWSKMLITFGHEHLKTLAVRTGETTHLAIRDGKDAFFIDHHSSNHHLIVVSGQT